MAAQRLAVQLPRARWEQPSKSERSCARSGQLQRLVSRALGLATNVQSHRCDLTRRSGTVETARRLDRYSRELTHRDRGWKCCLWRVAKAFADDVAGKMHPQNPNLWLLQCSRVYPQTA